MQFVNLKLYILHENIIVNTVFYNLSVNLNVFCIPFPFASILMIVLFSR